MISKKEIVSELVKYTLLKYLDRIDQTNAKFKDIDFSKFEYPVKQIKNGIYTYGSLPETIGDFFLFLEEGSNEGFLWIRSSFKDSGSYELLDFIFTSKKYENVHSFIKKDLDMEILRECVIDRYHNPEDNAFKKPVSLKKTFAYIMFSGARLSSHKRVTTFKTLGLLALHSCFKSKDFFNLGLTELSNRLLYERNSYIPGDTISNPHILTYDINNILALEIVTNIDYIVKNNIDLRKIIL